MDHKNSPDARHALYLNQAEGLLHSPQMFPLTLSPPVRKVPLTKPYTAPELAPFAQNSERTAVRRWVDQWRARRADLARQTDGSLDQAC
jgi:hypothetical protein